MQETTKRSYLNRFPGLMYTDARNVAGEDGEQIFTSIKD